MIDESRRGTDSHVITAMPTSVRDVQRKGCRGALTQGAPAKPLALHAGKYGRLAAAVQLDLSQMESCSSNLDEEQRTKAAIMAAALT